MTTTWNLTREQIAKAALRKVGNIARGETPSQDDLNIAYEALDGILKELPLYGYSWPQIATAPAALTLLANVPTVSLPSDYYGNPIVTYLDASGNEISLSLLSLSEWNEIIRKTDASAYPQFGYIGPDNVLHVWPVQTTNVSARLMYQKILSDTSPNVVSGIDQTMVQGLIYGVSAEIGDEFNATAEQISRWTAIWIGRRSLGIMARTYASPGRITVDDDCYPSRSTFVI